MSQPFNGFPADGMFHPAGVLLGDKGIDPHEDQASLQYEIPFQYLLSGFIPRLRLADQFIGIHRQETAGSQTLHGITNAGLAYLQFFGDNG